MGGKKKERKEIRRRGNMAEKAGKEEEGRVSG